MTEAATLATPVPTGDAPGGRTAVPPPAAGGTAWRDLLGRGLWAVVDQGCFALSNFGLSVLLARWLPQREYGAFAFVFSLFLLLGTIYQAVLPEPMLVFGAVRFERSFGSYLRTLLAGHALVMSGASALLAGAALYEWFRGSPVMATAFASWTIAAPCVTLSWLLRRAAFSRNRPDLAAAAGVAQLALMIGLLLLFHAAGTVTLFGAMGIAASVNVVTSAWLYTRLRGNVAFAPIDGGPRSIFRLHWAYGRWAVGGGLLTWLCTYSYYLVLPYRGGLEATAALRALYTLGIPVSHAQAALATLLIPSLVRARASEQFGRLLRLALATFAVGSVTGWLALGLAGPRIVHIAYGGRYDAYGHMLWLVAAVPIAAGGCDVLRSALRAEERPDQVFWSFAVAAGVTATVGMGLTLRFGVFGPPVGEIASGLVAAAVMLVGLRRVGVGRTRAPAAHESGTIPVAVAP